MAEGELANTITHEPEHDWPDVIEISAIWLRNGRKPRKRGITISRDEFFGLGLFGAPMSGEQLISAINRIRKA